MSTFYIIVNSAKFSTLQSGVSFKCSVKNCINQAFKALQSGVVCQLRLHHLSSDFTARQDLEHAVDTVEPRIDISYLEIGGVLKTVYTFFKFK